MHKEFNFRGGGGGGRMLEADWHFLQKRFERSVKTQISMRTRADIGQFIGNICIQTFCRWSTKCRVRLDDCPKGRTDLSLHVFILSTLGVDCEQTAMCRFIEAFA